MAQEAKAGARQGRRQDPGGRLVQAEAHRHQANGGDARHPGRQAIEAIEPVDRVGDAHQPNHRGQQTEGFGQHQGRIRTDLQKFERQINGADPNSLAPGRHRHRHLGRQSGQRRQGPEVIGQADQEKAEGPLEGGPDQAILGRFEAAKPTEAPDQGQGEGKASHDADAAQAHHRRGVLLARIGPINQAPTQAGPPHHRHHRRGDQGRAGKSNQGSNDRTAGDRHGRSMGRTASWRRILVVSLISRVLLQGAGSSRLQLALAAIEGEALAQGCHPLAATQLDRIITGVEQAIGDHIGHLSEGLLVKSAGGHCGAAEA